jgi:hypothetical protein
MSSCVLDCIRVRSKTVAMTSQASRSTSPNACAQLHRQANRSALGLPPTWQVGRASSSRISVPPGPGPSPVAH